MERPLSYVNNRGSQTVTFFAVFFVCIMKNASAFLPRKYHGTCTRCDPSASRNAAVASKKCASLFLFSYKKKNPLSAHLLDHFWLKGETRHQRQGDTISRYDIFSKAWSLIIVPQPLSHFLSTLYSQLKKMRHNSPKNVLVWNVAFGLNLWPHFFVRVSQMRTHVFFTLVSFDTRY